MGRSVTRNGHKQPKAGVKSHRPQRRSTWPTDNGVPAPFSEPPIENLGYRNHRRTGGQLSEDEFKARSNRLYAAIQEAWEGGSVGPIAALAEALGITDDQQRYDTPPPPMMGQLPTEEMMFRLQLDYCPAAGAEAPDRVLGPFADTADRDAHVISVAATVFANSDALHTPAFRQWSRRTPRPPLEKRDMLCAVRDAPHGLWEVTGWTDDGRPLVKDVLGMGRRLSPVGGVHLMRQSHLLGETPKRYLLSRIVLAKDPGSDQLVATGYFNFWLDRIPEPDLLQRMLYLLVTEYRIEDRFASVPAVLRHRGHDWVRRLLTWRWCAHR